MGIVGSYHKIVVLTGKLFIAGQQQMHMGENGGEGIQYGAEESMVLQVFAHHHVHQ